VATQPQTGLTYDDLLAFPEDNLRRELIDGELIVTASPSVRHQGVVLELGARLLAYAKEQGGKVYIAPLDVYFSYTTVVEPDILFVTADHLGRVEERFIRGAPDVVVEVSSPSTRRLELIRKRDLYLREAVTEYWYIDLDAEEVYVDRLVAGSYVTTTYRRGDTVVSKELPGFEIAVDDILS